MPNILPIEIAETREQLRALLTAQSTAGGVERVLALYLLKTGSAPSLRELATVMGKDYSTLFRWLRRYQMAGLDGLLAGGGARRGRKSAITQSMLDKLRERLQQPGAFGSYKEVQAWLRRECGVHVSYRTAHEAVRYRLNFCLKTGTYTANRNSTSGSRRESRPLVALGSLVR